MEYKIQLRKQSQKFVQRNLMKIDIIVLIICWSEYFFFFLIGKKENIFEKGIAEKYTIGSS